MNRKVIPALAAIAICLCPSCGKLTGDGGKSHAIRVKVSGVDTKAQVVTTSTLVETLQEFNMSAYVTQAWSRDVLDGTTDDIPAGLYFNDVKVYSDGTQKWTVYGNENEESPAWSWVNGVPINFFAYAPVSVNGTRTLTKDATSITTEYPFSYATKIGTTGKVTSADCDDIIFAGVTNTAQYGDEKDRPDVPAGQGYGQDEAGYGELINGTTDTINLHFYHALSQVRFCLSTDDGTFPTTLKLISVKLKDFVTKGSCIFSAPYTFAWTLSSDAADKSDYIQTFTDAMFGRTDSGSGDEIIPANWVKSSYKKDSQTYNLYTCTGDVFFFLPQNPAGKELELTLQVGNGEPFTVPAKLSAVDAADATKIWEPGKYYTYKIKAFKTVTVELIANDWIDGGSEITI